MLPSDYRYWLASPQRRPLVVGIINTTPDSFSDGGRHTDAAEAAGAAAAMVAAGADVSHSVELFDLVNRQDFEACARTQPSMSSRAYRDGGVLVPSEHHISEFHSWLRSRLA